MKMGSESFSLAYDDQGSGNPVLCIHGFPLDRRMWRPQVNGLSDIARVIAPDLPGFGASAALPLDTETPKSYSMERFADDLVMFLDDLGVNEPVVLCALSMGGYIALAFAHKYPQRTAGMILAATRASADSAQGKASRDASVRLALEKGVKAVSGPMLPKLLANQTQTHRPDITRWVDNMLTGVSLGGMVGSLLGMKERPDFTPLLASIQCPVMVISGAEDPIIAPEETEKLVSGIPGAIWHNIPAAAHMPNLEQSEAFNAYTRLFLESL